MKLCYSHYYFKNTEDPNAPLYAEDIRPILRAYAERFRNGMRPRLRQEDGEHLFLLPTENESVYMLVATRNQDIIKAINTQTLACSDIENKLDPEETTCFAAYFGLTEDVIATASTLRGPRSGALRNFINLLLRHLGLAGYTFEMRNLTTSISTMEAQAMAFVARTSMKITETHPLFKRIVRMLGEEETEASSISISVAGKRKRNIRDVFSALIRASEGVSASSLKIRAAVADEALSDYYVETDGKMSDEIGKASESDIIASIANRLHVSERVRICVNELYERYEYSENGLLGVSRLAGDGAWDSLVSDDMAEPEGGVGAA